jgi:hypothetical protein
VGSEKSHPYLLEEFQNNSLKSVGSGNEATLTNFADCVRLNEYGLPMGPFVREVDRAANAARFRPERNYLADTIADIRDHMLGFQPPLLSKVKPDSEWNFAGPCSSYGFILVSRPPDIRPKVSAYVNRA